ncbi:hypothetical protein [Streptomyces sp. 6N223]|uniref:hypothetical protein n=1 Tax=Streptomyces sp. 6N223 TaxID=3457412 RepID=UPI003FD34EAF
MRHEMRAEHEGEEAQGGKPGRVRFWHMVRAEEAVAMCGRPLPPGAAALPEEEWGRTAEPFCHTCGAMYLREIP